MTGSCGGADLLVSVVIPCYQAVGYIEFAIASAFGQSYSPLEVIVVDDGSSDGSYELVSRVKRERFPALKILTHEGRANLGVSVSRYLGLAHAEGELIAFLDADDQFKPDKLSQQVPILLASPEVVLCHTGVCAIGDDASAEKQEEHFAKHPEQPYLIRKRRRYLSVNGICTSTVLVRADALRRVPFAMPQLFQYEDWLCWVLLGRYGKFLFLNERLTLYRLHPTSATAAVQRSPLKRGYSTLEFKLALVARSESMLHSLRCLVSAGRSIFQLVRIYLSWPGAPDIGAQYRLNILSRIVLNLAKARRIVRERKAGISGRNLL